MASEFSTNDSDWINLEFDIARLNSEINGIDENVTPVMRTGYYYTVTGGTNINSVESSSAHYSGNASTSPPTDGLDISSYVGKKIKILLTSRSSVSGRSCAVLNLNNTVIYHFKESDFIDDGSKSYYIFTVPADAKWLFLSGSSSFILESVIVIGSESGLIQEIELIKDELEDIGGRIDNIETGITDINNDITDINNDITDINNDITDINATINGGSSADIDITPTTTTGYYYIIRDSILSSVAASTAHYSGTVNAAEEAPIGGIDISGFIGSQLKVTVNNILAASQRVSAIVNENGVVLDSIQERYMTQDGNKYSTVFTIPPTSKWFFFSGSSVCDIDSVKILGTQTVGLLTRVSNLENDTEKKALNVLNIGSSFSVNSFVQFPAIAIAGGIDLVAGCLYEGGATLEDIVAIINGSGNFTSGKVYTKDTNSWINVSNNIDAMLNLYDWDIIILQRSAPNKTGGSDSWTASMADDLETIIQYIQDNTHNSPKILFNSCFSRSVEFSGFSGSRSAQKASVELIMSTAKDMQSQFGLEVIPAAIAIQNARNTSLSYVQTYNSSGYTIPDLTGEGEHLDTGVGSYILGCLLYEFILGKMFNISILTNTVLPTLANITNNGCFADSCFTQITQEQAQIARYAAMCAVRDPWIINEGLAERFPYPTV